jgi:hypothetical protein
VDKANLDAEVESLNQRKAAIKQKEDIMQEAEAKLLAGLFFSRVLGL